uniref:Aminopeptidase O (putative) n=2 Tax=Sus scrofa TaxID=9823 RepID=A0A8D0PMG0_PIG
WGNNRTHATVSRWLHQSRAHPRLGASPRRLPSCAAAAPAGLRGEVPSFALGGVRPGASDVRVPQLPASLLPDQLLLLLEHLLEQTTLNPRTLQRLERTYHLPEQDAEVRHRWCELVVKHKYKKAYGHVERFLQEDQAMGIYLYGELMVNEDARQQQLARKCFELSKEQMDRSSAEVVAEMLF